MKKLISIIVLLTVCMTLTACSTTSENNISENESKVIEKRSLEGLKIVKSGNLDYTVSYVDTFEDLESWSDLIVIGEFIDNSSICFRLTHYDHFLLKEVESQVISSCPIRITKVLAGDVRVGDVVNVLQEEHICDGKFKTRSKLTPMQMGDEWLFCLEHCEDERLEDKNSYFCVSDNKGRYPTKNIGANEIMCFSDYPELGVYEQRDFQEEFYNELLEKYGEF